MTSKDRVALNEDGKVLCDCQCVRVSHCGGYVKVAVTGRLTIEDMAAVLDLLERSPDVPNDVPTLFDFRRADLTKLTAEEVRRYASVVEKHPDRKQARQVRLVSNALSFGLMRMCQTLCDIKGVAPEGMTLVTYSISEAFDWLGVTPSVDDASAA